MSRSICLDSSALSPKEFEAYKDFITEFDTFSLPRGGHVRFAEAAQFLRKWYPFETDKEDEIRSFFPQKLQLGQMTSGCILALLRLLSHLQRQSSPIDPSFGSALYRDLIFIQTEPLQPLSQSSSSPRAQSITRSTSYTSNPFRLKETNESIINSSDQPLTLSPSVISPRHRSFGSSDVDFPASPSKSRDKVQPFSTSSINGPPLLKLKPTQLGLPKLSVNPFRHPSSSSSVSPNPLNPPGSPVSSQGLVSPPVPPRPSISASIKPNGRPVSRDDDDQTIPPQLHHIPTLPPPKHYTQQHQQRGFDSTDHPGPSSSDDKRSSSNQSLSSETTPRPSTPPLIPLLPNFTKPKIIPRIVKSIPNSSEPDPFLTLSPDNSHVLRKSKGIDPPARPLNGYQGGSAGTPHHHRASSSTRPQGPPPPPPPVTKPSKGSLTTESDVPLRADPNLPNDRAQPPTLPPKSTLLRSQTLNHYRDTATPPVPPPRKRPESLQIYNPHSVPLEELAKQKIPSGVELEPAGTLWNRPLRPQTRTADSNLNVLNADAKTVKLRTVSHGLSQTPLECPTETEEELIEERTGRGRSISLYGQGAPKVGDHRTNQISSTNHLKQLRALEHGLRADGRELVKDVKEGWESRHGRREERVRLVGGRPNERGSHLPRVGKIWPTELLHHHHQPRQKQWKDDDSLDGSGPTHLVHTSDEEGWSRLD
ncbi:hypothetical protein CROQUDRAFT_672155 [Cronartium quercuum f. sp. fusiforme G11]|uniref:Uncharacterized protein n=1 Tax=Cronartium quercuum f. sp. fusiforme G11 TaxID=708437 RepID=A0A9P6NIN7_9BASI|nr:hypothetical protein CROQUDRAFT_672155 [Cronartium quercuum f. sp. fusiforme G11]